MSTNRLEVESCEIFSLDQIGGLSERHVYVTRKKM